MSKAVVYLDSQRVISPISPMLFSGFVEHMGRCVYQGIFDPASPHADENGLRKDVLAALRELNYRSIRYPGGNFLSGYRWQDVFPKGVRSAYQLAGTDPKAVNSFENPNQVVALSIAAPEIRDGSATLLLPPLSFTILDVVL